MGGSPEPPMQGIQAKRESTQTVEAREAAGSECFGDANGDGHSHHSDRGLGRTYPHIPCAHTCTYPRSSFLMFFLRQRPAHTRWSSRTYPRQAAHTPPHIPAHTYRFAAHTLSHFYSDFQCLQAVESPLFACAPDLAMTMQRTLVSHCR